MIFFHFKLRNFIKTRYFIRILFSFYLFKKNSFPFRLKIGAKSKKDPHIRVGGRTEEGVMRAKMMISEVLDTSTNSRVTMKMDVSYTDHSHIIGKGGNTIRRVMAETNCHIHFPDSNRSNPNEKSNQVRVYFRIENLN